ncbi:hypothetical protein [Dyadobacter diqingensis]|uniref:hypothetical protein n=1 Tax=Dyadobacter diqingensis TaxID=2938121 RepID=UPI0020C22DE1|nr:hypothetical protein [Dyadobacter diqingensis]
MKKPVRTNHDTENQFEKFVEDTNPFEYSKPIVKTSPGKRRRIMKPLFSVRLS